MKRWQIVETPPAAVEEVAAAQGLPRPLAGLLLSRGYETAESIDAFLRPRLSALSDPFDLAGVREAAGRIRAALEAGERIVVFGDYDVDGVTSTALLVKVLKHLGGRVEPFLPHRVDDGYGLSPEALDKCLAEHQPGLIVTVDCGTGSAEAVERARAAGTDVVVSDHHEPGGTLASAHTVVNPRVSGQESFQNLAGVGVTFKLCHGLLKLLRDGGNKAAAGLDLRRFMDLVALGTVADIVPLVGENRALVREGLRCLGRTDNLGLRALVEVTAISGPVSAYHVGFILGPRLNAAGRLDDAMGALELLLTEDAARARELAVHLDGINRERQEVERGILKTAVDELDARFDPAEDYALVVAGEGWHPGVVGIVASRICERYYRPAVVIGLDGDGRGRGSCRSIDGFSMVEALGACSEFLVKHGGHAMAAGLEIETKQVPAFRSRFAGVAREHLAGRELVPTQRIDGWMELGQADEVLIAGLESFQPFGHQHPTPVWATRGVSVVGTPRIVGQGHLKMRVAAGGVERDCIGFNLGGHPVPEGRIDIAYQVKMNSFRSRESVQLTLKDFRAG